MASGRAGTPYDPPIGQKTGGLSRRSPGISRRLTTFVGRDAEVVALAEELRGHPLVTLVGTGGVGKTRLALETAAGMAGDFPGGTCVVDLCEVDDPALLPVAVAAAAGAEIEADIPLLQAVAGALSQAPALLVLDNAQHLARETSSLVKDLLSECPELTVMATSRVPLDVDGQRIWTVEPLPVPPDDGDDPARLAGHASVRLFVDRARAAVRTFRLDAASAPAVASICRRVDGLPLAIELTASWVRALSPADIEKRLVTDLTLLEAPPRGPTGRHEALSVVLDGSYHLLEPAERVLFDRLSCFAGTFSIEAASAVCSDETVGTGSVVGLLAGLVDQSLVTTVEAAGGRRFRMLTTTRAYAASHLSVSDEDAVVRGRHARWFLGEAKRLLAGGDPGAANGLETDHDNLVAALGWAVGSDARLAVDLFLTLRPYWRSGGRPAEGCRWAEAVLTGLGNLALRPETVAAAAETGAELALVLGDYERAGEWLEQSLSAYRAAGDGTGQGRVVLRMGMRARYRGDLTGAASLISQAEALLVDTGGSEYALCLAEHGQVVALRGDAERGEAALNESLARARQANDAVLTADILNQLGRLSRMRDSVGEARRRHEEALALHRGAHDLRGTARSLTGLGEVAWMADDFAGARAAYEEALPLQRRVGDLRGTAASLCRLADLDYESGRPSEARRLYAESLNLRRHLGDRRGEAVALVGLATSTWLDEPTADRLSEALEMATRAVEIQHQVGEPRGLAWALACQAEIARDAGEPAAARAAASESLILFRRLGEPAFTTHALFTLSWLALGAGQVEEAHQLMLEACRLALALGKGMQQLRCVELAARIACAAGRFEDSARLYAAATAGRDQLGQGAPRRAQREVAAADRALLEQRLEAESRQRAEGHGRSLTIPEACAVILAREGSAGPAEVPEPVAASWRIRLLGDTAVERDGRRLELPGPIPTKVLAGAATLGPVAVDQLVELLWPDAGPGIGRRRLRNVLTRLRDTCGGLVLREGEGVRLAAGAAVDAAEFEVRARAALAAHRDGDPDAPARCREAVVLYGGPLLPAMPYDDWTVIPRVRLSRLYVDLLDALADAALTAGRPGEAVEWLERGIEAEPLDLDRCERAAAIMLEEGWAHRARSVAARARRVSAELRIPLPPTLSVALRPPS